MESPSTSFNFNKQPSAISFDEIDSLLLKQLDYIVNLPAAESKNTASKIIKQNDL
jgi:tRNA A37 threonylcarbamoyladenosine synthetase subunit TsaC/SUA5/YrdC